MAGPAQRVSAAELTRIPIWVRITRNPRSHPRCRELHLRMLQAAAGTVSAFQQRDLDTARECAGDANAYFAQGRPAFHGKAVHGFTPCRSSARDAGRM